MKKCTEQLCSPIESLGHGDCGCIHCLGAAIYNNRLFHPLALLQEVLGLANQHRITSPASLQVSPAPSIAHGLDRHGPATPHVTRLGTIMSSVPGTRAATAVSGLTDETVIGDMFGHYCSLVYDAVLEAVVSSLMLMGDCVKPLGRVQSGVKVTVENER